jgi:hypothetical protein
MLIGCGCEVDRGATSKGIFTISLRGLQGFVQTELVQDGSKSLKEDGLENIITNAVDRCLKEYWHDPGLKWLVVSLSKDAWLSSVPGAHTELAPVSPLAIVEIEDHAKATRLALLSDGAVTDWNLPLNRTTNNPAVRLVRLR